jgi:hypothetical protein
MAAAALTSRISESRFSERFSLAFMGDTHIGKSCRCNEVNPAKEYVRLLHEVLVGDTRSRDTLCIIHGGDATHVGRPHLTEFVQETKRVLGYGRLPQKDQVPFFLNIGNHEYIDDTEGNAYRDLVGNPGDAQYIWLNPQRTCIILLDTGLGNRGGFPDNSRFQAQLDTAASIITQHPDYHFVIDMHIPPAVGPYRCTILVLNKIFTRQFNTFLGQHPNRIAAVVTHHRHFVAPSARPYCRLAGVPLFITAHAGHCDFPRLACLKLTFVDHPYYGWSIRPSLISLA